MAKGGLCFRANFGVERNGESLLAEGSYPEGSEIKDGYPEFTMAMAETGQQETHAGSTQCRHCR